MLAPTALPALTGPLGSGLRTDGVHALLRDAYLLRAGPVRHLADMTDAEIAEIERTYGVPVVLRAGPVQRAFCLHASLSGQRRCRAAPEPGRLFCRAHGPRAHLDDTDAS